MENYSELKTSIANWMDRADLNAVIPDFIKLTEAQFNRTLRLRSMEKKYHAKTVGGQSNYNLPAGYIQMREFRLNTTPTRSLQYITPEIYESWNFVGSGLPKWYTVIANEIRLGPAPSGEYDMEMLFWQKIPNLSETNTTNWLLSNAPDMYLYGSLSQAEAFIQNDPRIALWKQGFEEAMATLSLQDEKDRHSGSTLMVRS